MKAHAIIEADTTPVTRYGDFVLSPPFRRPYTSATYSIYRITGERADGRLDVDLVAVVPGGKAEAVRRIKELTR